MGIPVGILTSPESTLSPISPMTPKEKDEHVRSAPQPGKRICGLRQKHFWELSGLIVAILLAAAIIGGVVGGLQSRHGKSSSSGQPAPSNSSKNTTDNSNTTIPLPLQYALVWILENLCV